MVVKAFGLHLKNLRQKQKWSQQDLANKCFLHTNYISDIECGRRNVSIITLSKLAMAFSISLHDLMDFKYELS